MKSYLGTIPTFLLALLVSLACTCAASASPGPQEAATGTTTSSRPDGTQAREPAYHLPPEKLRLAIRYSRQKAVLGLAGELWGILVLVLLLTTGGASRFQAFAARRTRHRWLQGLLFTALLLAVTSLADLPFDLYGHHLSLLYAQSVQGWGSWFADQAKFLALTFVIGAPLVLLLFWVIRRSPRHWWFWFWIPAMLLVVLGVFVTPVLIDPLFNRFEPLAKSDPALVQRLEQVVERGGITIPPERMFLMRASDKVTGLNAYVTGIGASKRVVVWDTTVAKATPDEISFIFGHELGHYVLQHIWKTLASLALFLLAQFYLGYRLVTWLLGRYGSRCQIRSAENWASLVVLLLVLSVLGFLSEPITNGYSRMHEHDADVYGQEAVHGIVADPQTVAQQAFQVLGETSLVDPYPNPLLEFWTFSHPSISRRAAFARAYNPWLPPGKPRYFSEPGRTP